jgi:hypothetical protein
MLLRVRVYWPPTFVMLDTVAEIIAPVIESMMARVAPVDIASKSNPLPPVALLNEKTRSVAAVGFVLLA